MTALSDAINWLSTAAGNALDWLLGLPDSVWGILEVLVAPSIAVLISALVLLAFRRAILWRRGRSHRVQVTQFSWAGPASEDREAIWITSKFREHLASLQLDPLDAIPDRAPGAPLVEIVEGVGQGVAHGLDLGRAIGRLWRAGVPDSAYEVWATLRPLEKDEGLISVQLIERAGGNRTLTSFTSKGPSWESSAREAAMAVAGALYPRVANRYKGPWTTWRETVPAHVIELYQRALEAESDNRPEQALGAFRATLRKDPLNPHLRLKVAMLEERLNLHLDAWFTYQAIVAEGDRDLWKGPDRRVRLLALYRLAIHLWNPRVAEQWVEPDKKHTQVRHGEALERLRKVLLVALNADPLFKGEAKKECEERKLEPARGSATELTDALTEFRSGGSRKRQVLLDPFEYKDCSKGRVERIHQVLQIISLRNLEELEGRMRVWPLVSVSHPVRRRARQPPLRRRWRREFSLMTIGVSRSLVRLRIAATIGSQLEASKRKDGLDRVVAESRRLAKRWPFPSVGLPRRAARIIYPRLWWANRRDDAWQLHYNAGCTIASVLLKKSILSRQPDFDSKPYVKAATLRFEEYAHRANSGRVAGKADWLAFEDPDLEGLVERPEFRLWASHHLAIELPEKRPKRVVDTERYTALIVQRAAAAFAASWRERAAMDSVPAGSLVSWWRDEQEIWERLASLCSQHQSWRYRLGALKALEHWTAANGLGAVDLAYEDRDGATPLGQIPKELFVTLAKAIEEKDCERPQVLPWTRKRAEEVQGEHDERLRRHGPYGFAALPKDEREMAVSAAQIWSLLAEALKAGLGDRPADLLTKAAWEQAWKDPLKRIPGKISIPAGSSRADARI